MVSGNCFSIFRQRPHVGRLISDQNVDDQRPVAVLSHALWQNAFGGRMDALGKASGSYPEPGVSSHSSRRRIDLLEHFSEELLMTMHSLTLTVGTAIGVACSAPPADAQAGPALAAEGSRVEISTGAGVGNLFVIDGPSFGKALNVGLGASVRVLKRLWLDVDMNRLVGLKAAAAPCGLVNKVCFGNGREGFEEVTAGALALTYHFGGDTTHLYVTGGYGFIHSKGFQTVTFAATGEQVESPLTLSGWGTSAGAGLRIPFRLRWALKPEVRISSGGPTSLRATMSLARTW